MGRTAVALCAAMSAIMVVLGVPPAGDGNPRSAAAVRPLLGVMGDVTRFRDQTGQDSTVVETFLGWGQGADWGKPLANLLPTLAPIPLIHLGTGRRSQREVITPADIAAGRGDSYLVFLNTAIAQWGRGIYVRPMAEMNNPGNVYSGYDSNGRPRDAAHSPAAYRKAFARIFLILHGGSLSAVNARLRGLGLPPVTSGNLASNPFPRLRIVWSPLAGGSPRVPGNAPEMYYPGRSYVDIEGGDIYDESLTDSAPWSALEDLYRLALSHRKPFSVPEWGLFLIDDPAFVGHMCAFLRSHGATEMEVFFQSKPGSIFDLATKPKSRAAYRRCITPLGGPVPAWAAGTAATAIAVSLMPGPSSGEPPLAVQFAIVARLTVPIERWQLLFGDGTEAGGAGPPPATVPHSFIEDGAYEATLIVYQAPPFAPESASFLTSATVTVGTAPTAPVSFKATPPAGRGPLKVVFETVLNLPGGGAAWEMVFGDGSSRRGAGNPPHFSGHTFEKAGAYRVILIVDGSPSGRYLASTDVTVRAGPTGSQAPARGTPTGTVLVNGKPFTGGLIRYGSRVDVTRGTLTLRTDSGTLAVFGAGVSATFVLRRGTDNGRANVELRLVGGDFSVCGKAGRKPSVAKAPPPKTVRRLWGKGKGQFRTLGRYAAVTVRGTFWLTADRCDGTLAQIRQGTVSVRDLVQRKTVVVRAGHSYLAKKP